MVPDHDNPQPNGEPGWKPENPAEPVQKINNVWIGKVGEFPELYSHGYLKLCTQIPIMVRSQFCTLHGLSERETYDLNECPYDQVNTSLDLCCMWPTLLFVAGRLLHH